ncbi:uncharacterized protein LY89DRAFT_719102 [Mollisia scopiformis]|uniref:Zn(2)-C6 fungal-type domain-containing protein n=1 Tax=Mollisia scopiformis TaxID=149040 RepID=A0A194X880_MOLSC|nr:uncharacterized protein LY89DRAFT_719102 [Mollisia scopiformis]KUJ16375.1 hypothetical protein LY89DRAFT_719102 [Mollisia scopiformis]
MDIQEIREPEAQSLGTKKKRKSLAKVRTGCKTCKIRRVKCDETRPVCQRCLKWGGASICDGYEDLVPTRTFRAVDLKAAHRPLLPNPKPLCRSPNVQKFDSDEEYSFFQRFCVESTVQLSGSRYSELWNRVVLQGSEMEACVRHAVVAIGALDFHKLSHGGTDLQSIHREFTFREYGALTAVGMMNASPWSKKVSDEDRMGRKIAYEEYGKAIKCLRKAVMEKRSDIMTRLTSCLLFILFEVYHGNNESAAAQTHAGIKMMEEHSKQRSEWTPSLGTIRPPPIDREIVETFALLEIQATGWSDNNRPDMHLAKIYAGEAIEDIPYEFKTLKHAAFVLSTIMLRGAHLRFVRRTPPYIAPEEIVTALTTLEPVYTVGPEHAEFCNVLNRFQQWKAAFEPLFRRARTESGKHLKKGAITLKIHYLSSYLWTASGAPLPEMYYRRHTKELVLSPQEGQTGSHSNIQDLAQERRLVGRKFAWQNL